MAATATASGATTVTMVPSAAAAAAAHAGAGAAGAAPSNASYWVQAAESVPSCAPDAAWRRAGALLGGGAAASGDVAPTLDVAIIGGGIVGMSSAVAVKLANPSLRVAILEARRVGGGTTGFSTCKLSSQHSIKYSTLIKDNGVALATEYAAAHTRAIAIAEEWTRAFKLDCDFSRRDSTLFTTTGANVAKLRDEAEAARAAGIADIHFAEASGASLSHPDLPGAALQATLTYRSQAQFNAYSFVNELARHFVAVLGGTVHESTLVTDVSLTRSAAPASAEMVHTVTTASGAKLHAARVIVATHLPFLDSSLHFALCTPSRSYCLAVKLEAGCHVPQQLYMSVDEPVRSLRSAGPAGDVFIVSGAQHHVGDADPAACYAELEGWARKHYRVSHVIARWSAMDYYPADNRPYIGRLHRGTDTIFTATGFGKWGLTTGIIASQVFADLITRPAAEPAWLAVFDSTRWEVTHAARGALQESWHTLKHLVGDKVKHATAHARALEELRPG